MSNTLYIGIDIGKRAHHAAFISRRLISETAQRKPFAVPNSRSGFQTLIERARAATGPRARIAVLLERTGHYGDALIQFLQEQHCLIYRTQPRKRYGRDKTDARDAATLAMLLYNHLELEIQPADPLPIIRPLVPPSELARRLRGLVRHRYELVNEIVQRKNKLTGLLDELFPEFAGIIADPNRPSALAIRSAFPTPSQIAEASLADLLAARISQYPTAATLADLQAAARATIGTKDQARIASAMIEQRQLIAELLLLEQHRQELDALIETEITAAPEGRALLALDCIGPVQAATLIAGIGAITNFPSAAHLRSYLGWAPRRRQTGSTFDTDDQPPGGNKLLKRMLYLITLSAIQRDPWKARYDRLVERKCNYDARHGRYLGKMRVIGRIAGDIAGLIYRRLRAVERARTEHLTLPPSPASRAARPASRAGRHAVASEADA